MSSSHCQSIMNDIRQGSSYQASRSWFGLCHVICWGGDTERKLWDPWTNLAGVSPWSQYLHWFWLSFNDTPQCIAFVSHTLKRNLTQNHPIPLDYTSVIFYIVSMYSLGTGTCIFFIFFYFLYYNFLSQYFCILRHFMRIVGWYRCVLNTVISFANVSVYW